MRIVWGRCSPQDEAGEIAHEGWGSAPVDVVSQVLTRLITKERWTARQVSSVWAHAARQTAAFEVVLPVHTTNVLSKVKLLSKRQLTGPNPNISFTLKLLEPLQLAELASLLQQLSNEGSNLVTFSLTVNLFIADRCDLEQLTMYAAQIASTSAALLNFQGVTVCISLCSSPQADIPPSPLVLQQLAPFLHNIDLYSVPAKQMASIDPSLLRRSAFSPAHITALDSCSTSLTALCISDHQLISGHDMPALAVSIPAIAQLSSLTKLHLSLARSNPVADFQPLSQLSALEDLALQCRGSPASCHGVLTSCRSRLQRVTLAACCWSLATYMALGPLLLDTVVIKLWRFNVEQALGMPLLTARETKVQIFNFRGISVPALVAWFDLSHIMEIHELTVWAAEDDGICLLGSMPLLRTLVIVNSSGFTGSTLPCQPSVTELKLISCPHVSNEGLRHMLAAALPAVKSLAFQASCNGSSLQVTLQTVETLVTGQFLESTDLQGVHGLTSQAATKLRSLFMKQANIGKAQPSVTLQLPLGKLGEHQPIIRACSNLYVPTLQLLPGCNESRRLHTKQQQNIAILPFCAAVSLPLCWKSPIGYCRTSSWACHVVGAYLMTRMFFYHVEDLLLG